MENGWNAPVSGKNFEHFIEAVAAMDDYGQPQLPGLLNLNGEGLHLFAAECGVPVQVDADFANGHVAAGIVETGENLLQVVAPVFAYLGGVQSHGAGYLAREAGGEGFHRLDGRQIDVGKHHVLHAHGQCAAHGIGAVVVAVKFGQVKMGVRVNHHLSLVESLRARAANHSRSSSLMAAPDRATMASAQWRSTRAAQRSDSPSER